MLEEEIDILLLTKPSNMYYFTGDGRLCSYVMINRDGQVALGIPQTDEADVRNHAHFDHIATFEDEIGMIHSIADFFKQFSISKGAVGLEYTFLTQAMMGMVTHPHAKPDDVIVKNCTDILSQMRLIKEPYEIELMREAAIVADAGMEAAR